MKSANRALSQPKSMQYLFLLTALSLFISLVYFSSHSEPEWACPLCPAPACGSATYLNLPKLPQKAISWEQLRGAGRQLTSDDSEVQDSVPATYNKAKQKSHYLLFAAVLSGAKNFDDRHFLRNQSWMTMLPGELGKSVTHKFILGQLKTAPKDNPEEAARVQALEEAIRAEQERYGDIVVLDMIDDYHNLTLKLAKTLIWAHQQQEFTYDFMMKIDDDVWVNAERLVHFLRNETLCCKTRQVIGRINTHARVIRDHEHKWGDQYYPSNEYVPYPNGPCYVLTRDVVGWLATQHMSGVLACYRNEDVTLGAWVFGTTIILKNAPEFDMEGAGPSADCFKEGGSLVYHLSSMWGLDSRAMKKISRQAHVQFTDRWHECQEVRAKYMLELSRNATRTMQSLGADDDEFDVDDDQAGGGQQHPRKKFVNVLSKP